MYIGLSRSIWKLQSSIKWLQNDDSITFHCQAKNVCTHLGIVTLQDKPEHWIRHIWCHSSLLYKFYLKNSYWKYQNKEPTREELIQKRENSSWLKLWKSTFNMKVFVFIICRILFLFPVSLHSQPILIGHCCIYLPILFKKKYEELFSFPSTTLIIIQRFILMISCPHGKTTKAFYINI